MMPDTKVRSDEILDDIKRLIPILGKDKASRLEIAYLLGDEDYRKKIQEIVDAVKASVFSDEELKDSVLIEPPSKEIAANGDFKLGTVLYGKKELYPLMLNRRDLLTHIGIFGSSGSGKTNVVHWLTEELTKLDVPILIFDFSKRNYRDLLTIPQLKDRVRIFTVGRNIFPFRFNPLKPPEGVQISQWAKEFAEVFDHAYWLLGGGRHIILKSLDGLYNRYSPAYPKIVDLKNWLERYSAEAGSSREKNWISTAERPLESLCFRETGEVFDVDDGIIPSDFFKENRITVLELDSLSTDDKTFFIEIMLQWIRDWILASNMREKLLGVIVLEEAHHVLNREKTKKFGMETVTDLIFREIRELGIGMVYIDQHPSLVSYPALGNTSTHIYMNLGLDTKYSSDVVDAASMLGLRNEKDVDYLRRLPVGHAYILVRKSVFPNSFLIKFPLVDLKKGSITDEMISSLVEKEVKQMIETKRRSEPFKQDVERKLSRVDSTGWTIIEILANGEAAATSEIYKKLKMSCKTFNKHADSLVKLGLIESKKAKVYRQNSIFYFLTHDGEMAFLLRRGKFPEEKDEFSIEQMKEAAVSYFTLQGFSPVEDFENSMNFEKNHLKIQVLLENESRRGLIYKDVDKNSMGEIYFICSTEEMKNRVIQQAAKYSFEHRGLNLVVFVASVDDLKDNRMKKVEFVAG